MFSQSAGSSCSVPKPDVSKPQRYEEPSRSAGSQIVGPCIDGAVYLWQQWVLHGEATIWPRAEWQNDGVAGGGGFQAYPLALEHVVCHSQTGQTVAL